MLTEKNLLLHLLHLNRLFDKFVLQQHNVQHALSTYEIHAGITHVAHERALIKYAKMITCAQLEL